MKSTLLAVAWLSVAVLPAYGRVPVRPTSNYTAAVSSENPQLAANKRLVSEFWRTVLAANRIGEAGKYLAKNFIEHSVMSSGQGLAGFENYFRLMRRKPLPVPPRIRNLVAMVAEGNLVVVATVLKMKDPQGRIYPALLFDMFRIKDGKIAEHWDSIARPDSTAVLPFNNSGPIPKPN